MATPPLEIEFTPSALVARIVRGATENDPVRMHGAIAATVQLYRLPAACRDVFGPALQSAHEHSNACHDILADAIHDHLGLAAARSDAV